jgi:hypothetical protein
VIKELVDQLISAYSDENVVYNYEDYGWIVLLEESDLDGPLDDLYDDGTTFLDLDWLWEGISLRDGFYTAIYLANNESGMVFVIPDAPWLSPEVKDMLERHLDPPLELRK